MDRFAAMIILLGMLLGAILVLVSFFTVAPIISSCLISLAYTLYLFIAYEESGLHHGQEFENRFWTVFAVVLSTALFFASDSPLCFGFDYPVLASITALGAGYVMHAWDRYLHRIHISRQTLLRSSSSSGGSRYLVHPSGVSLNRLIDLGIPVEDQLRRINECLQQIDQTLIPSTINNFINQQYVLKKEREIISVFHECDARALNYLINHVKLGLLFYKIKDHRHFNGKHRTEFINLLAVERLSILTVVSRVIILHSLQLLKLRANPQAEHWVRNIILNTHQDDLSELKTLMDSKGDYFCMPKLVFDDIKSETVRQDILRHIRKEAAVQQTYIQIGKKRSKNSDPMQWRKVLSDVDDTLYCSGGMYPAGVDRKYARKTVYPGVLAFYRELDLGVNGPEEWPDDRVGNLVFLSARPHLYKDMSEKANYAKFEKLRALSVDGRKGMHTMPSLLAGDLSSGSEYIVKNNFEPLARKKFDNFRRFVSIYPEFQHIFVADNGQGDVRAGELMFDSFPYEFEALFVHIVTDLDKTYGYFPERWREKEFAPYFFRTYPEAALKAASRATPMIRVKGLQRICADAAKDFVQIKQFPSEQVEKERRAELNQAIWRANIFLIEHGEEPVELIQAKRLWKDGEKVRTPYGVGIICGFDASFDMYDVDLDWRPIDIQVAEYLQSVKEAKHAPPARKRSGILATVHEMADSDDEELRPVVEGSGSTQQQTGGESTEEPPRRRRPRPTGVTAQINGKNITKYTPPTLMKVDNKQSSGSIFTFFTPSSAEPTKKKILIGEQFSTPYGLAKVVAYREEDEIVEVEMIGWPAKAFLQKHLIKPVPKSLLSSFLERISKVEAVEPKKDFPYPIGTEISTPFGKGTLASALPSPKKGASKAALIQSTVGIRLEQWGMAGGSHAMLYATIENVQKWKENKDGDGDGTSIFSALETLVSSSTTLLTPFFTPKPKPPSPKVDRFFKDGAAVTTPFGKGQVRGFRESDGFYEVSLESWKLATGQSPRAYLRKDDMACRVAPECREGHPVLTTLGLSGYLASVEPTTGVHIVTIPSTGMVCYLQPEAIVKPLKAAIGEDVTTAYGEGRVQSYDTKNDIYHIRLSWNATLSAKGGESFERLGEGVPDRNGSFGVNWLLGLLFYPGQQQATVGTRTRSNSVSSVRSHSNSVVSAAQSNKSVS
mmetsp:Transcript_13845/g.27874  ORF Transcript_13845/g.27874 Transcript_13845/m.27874 type:complete len:1176 (-) Transcript_13845:114-3641(-)